MCMILKGTMVISKGTRGNYNIYRTEYTDGSGLVVRIINDSNKQKETATTIEDNHSSDRGGRR